VVMPRVTGRGPHPNTAYSYRVRARDTAGVMSAPSATVSFTTSRPAGGCDVAYSTNDWGGGFTATVTITNTGAVPVNPWSRQRCQRGADRLHPQRQRLHHLLTPG
jgi:hypothetical protein